MPTLIFYLLSESRICADLSDYADFKVFVRYADDLDVILKELTGKLVSVLPLKTACIQVKFVLNFLMKMHQLYSHGFVPILKHAKEEFVNA